MSNKGWDKGAANGTAELHAKIVELFKVNERKGKMEIERPEFVQVITKPHTTIWRPLGYSVEYADALFDTIDITGSGHISRAEFENHVRTATAFSRTPHPSECSSLGAARGEQSPFELLSPDLTGDGRGHGGDQGLV